MPPNIIANAKTVIFISLAHHFKYDNKLPNMDQRCPNLGDIFVPVWGMDGNFHALLEIIWVYVCNNLVFVVGNAIPI